MQVYLLAVGKRVPTWVETGYREYAKRLQGDVTLSLIEVPACRRSSKVPKASILREEGRRLLAAVPRGAWVVALDRHGTQWDSAKLSEQLQEWMGRFQTVAMLIGGAEGLDPTCLDKADQMWSLSPLTLPHALVRTVVAEQLYRAWSMVNNHPYHRG